ncbi:MAG: hypothetical protein F6K47_08590 [Symploca sp. SIO2E6]|nr:hypothetical protein [Symploca sp. SIO2E6]
MTSILAKKRGHVEEEHVEELPQPGNQNDEHNHIETQYFSSFQLDDKTVNNLEDYPKYGNPKYLSSYLPSPGVVFSNQFINSFNEEPLTTQDNSTPQLSDYTTQLGNYYTPIRFLLHSRKLSQLIAKTWWAYLEAKKCDTLLWSKFISGNWGDIPYKVLDGLIAREILLYGGADSPDNICDEQVYLPLKPYDEPDQEKTRFLILPSSKAWQGISLSLLLAGQAYYKRGSEYHQINPSILSTGEITMQYTLEVDWNRFNGDVKELIISNEKPWVGYHVIMPYPPIPADAEPGNMQRWADAKEDPDEEDNFPFYKKDTNGNYLIDVDYFRPPYPYIPLTCT